MERTYETLICRSSSGEESELGNHQVVNRCFERRLLDALVLSGLFGPSRETCAQRLLELKVFEISCSMMNGIQK
jgi:hypothetical protein